MTAVAYSRLIRRVRAVLIDSVILPVTLLSILVLGDTLGVSDAYGKVMLIAIPVLILEPGLVALTGGTVGHHLLGIRVAKQDGSGNINVFAAAVRFAVKLLLGWLSFILVLTTAKHQAVHDLVVRSIVVVKNPDELPVHEVLSERTLETDAYLYPSAWRRIVVIALYWVLATAILAALGPNVVFDIAWLLGLGWITVRGWNGRLFGCMRCPREAA